MCNRRLYYGLSMALQAAMSALNTSQTQPRSSTTRYSISRENLSSKLLEFKPSTSSSPISTRETILSISTGTSTSFSAQGHGYPPLTYTGADINPEHLKPLYDSLDLSNPLRRDTATVEGFGWILLRYRCGQSRRVGFSLPFELAF